jgi:hypothetical protein
MLKFRSSGMLEFRKSGILEFWSLEFWSSGVPEFRSAGVLECWSSGVLEFRSFQSSGLKIIVYLSGTLELLELRNFWNFGTSTIPRCF